MLEGDGTLSGLSGEVSLRLVLFGGVLDYNEGAQLRNLYHQVGWNLDYKSCQKMIFCQACHCRDVGERRTASDGKGDA